MRGPWSYRSRLTRYARLMLLRGGEHEVADALDEAVFREAEERRRDNPEPEPLVVDPRQGLLFEVAS